MLSSFLFNYNFSYPKGRLDDGSLSLLRLLLHVYGGPHREGRAADGGGKAVPVRLDAPVLSRRRRVRLQGGGGRRSGLEMDLQVRLCFR